jgi:hypothetical protein
LFLLRSAFWIVLVSFVLTGGDYERARLADGFAADAKHSASHIVETLSVLRTVCNGDPGWCQTGRDGLTAAGRWGEAASEGGAAAWDWAARELKALHKD